MAKIPPPRPPRRDWWTAHQLSHTIGLGWKAVVESLSSMASDATQKIDHTRYLLSGC